MQDNRISLDGTWEFLHVADDRLSGPAEVRQITVPSPWQAQFSDLRMRAGIGIYRRTIEIAGGVAARQRLDPLRRRLPQSRRSSSTASWSAATRAASCPSRST